MDELSVAVPTKGVKYVFACKCWLAKDRGDGLTSRVFNVLDAEAISICKRVRKHEQTVLKRRVSASGRKRREALQMCPAMKRLKLKLLQSQQKGGKINGVRRKKLT